MAGPPHMRVFRRFLLNRALDGIACGRCLQHCGAAPGTAGVLSTVLRRRTPVNQPSYPAQQPVNQPSYPAQQAMPPPPYPAPQAMPPQQVRGTNVMSILSLVFAFVFPLLGIV